MRQVSTRLAALEWLVADCPVCHGVTLVLVECGQQAAPCPACGRTPDTLEIVEREDAAC